LLIFPTFTKYWSKDIQKYGHIPPIITQFGVKNKTKVSVTSVTQFYQNIEAVILDSCI
jgi:hypothetical protein